MGASYNERVEEHVPEVIRDMEKKKRVSFEFTVLIKLMLLNVYSYEFVKENAIEHFILVPIIYSMLLK